MGPNRLPDRNPRLVILRISGFGQMSPYRRRPGFGTLAEAMSRFVHMNGVLGEPPLLPPIALADEVFRCSDGQWIAISGTAQSIVERIFKAIGQPGLAQDPRFVTNERRLENVEEFDGCIQGWISDRPLFEVIDVFERHEVAAAPVYDIRMILEDEQHRERNTLVRVPDEDLGSILLPDVQLRLSVSPGELRYAGGNRGSANKDVYGELGITAEDHLRLHDEGVV